MLHVAHAKMLCPGLVGENLRMAGRALVIHAEVEIMAEDCMGEPFNLEDDVVRLKTFVTGVAIIIDGECPLTVMTGSAGFPSVHFCHGHGLFFTRQDLFIVATLAIYAAFAQMECMAKDNFGCAFRFEGNVSRYALVAADTILFTGNAECFDTRVAGSA